MSQPPPQPYPPQQPYPPYPEPGYTPQYGFMPYYMTPPDALLGPARRASLMLFLLAAIFLLFGTCVGGIIFSANADTMNTVLADMKRMNPQQADMLTPNFVRTTYGVLAAVVVLTGVVTVILGVVVRGGRMAAAIVSLVLILVPALVLVVMLLGTLVAAIGNPEVLLGALLLLVPLVLIAMTAIFLVGAIRAAPQIEAARRQMGAMHQHQQMQYQAYLQQQPPPQV